MPSHQSLKEGLGGEVIEEEKEENIGKETIKRRENIT
jgi:hypothetical protein